MEYIQTVLFQIPASRLDEASAPDGLMPALDAHREYLRNQPGFRDMRITRSINPEGNVLMIVETRWTDDNSLVRYETSEPNAAAIVRAARHLLVADSLQVLDMEALRTESSWKPGEDSTQARERVILPIAIPLFCLAFALLAIYGLSRIYLEIGGDGAVALSAGIAIGVLLISFYLAMNPKVPGYQIAGIFVVLTLVLGGGTVWAVANEDEHDEEEQVEEPGGESPDPDESGGPGDGLVLVMEDNYFEVDGERNPTITVAAGDEISAPNEGAVVHNVHVAPNGGYGDCEEDICSDPEVVSGGGESVFVADLEPGEYDFRCDFHPTEMVGVLVVE